jgi:MFS family permease
MTASTAPFPSSALTSRRLRWLLAIVLTGQFMAVLDVSIVNVAIPTIRTDLHASGAALQLIVAGYTIAYAVLLITGARLGPIFGFRRSFIVGLTTFTLASLACGLAPTSELLVVARLVQGAGAALMVPQVFSLIQRSFDGAARARALSLWAAVIALGVLVGQIVGGVLVTLDIAGTGWRPVFLVNVPIGLSLVAASLALLPRDRRESARPLDLAGLIALAASVLLLVVPLVLGHEEGWPAWVFVSLAASAIVFAGFVLIERSVARRGGAPLIAARVVGAPGMVAALAGLALGMAAYAGFLFSFAQHVQIGLHETPLAAGLSFAPMALGFAVGSLNWRRLPATWHLPLIPIGFLTAACAYVVTAVAIDNSGTGGPALALALATAGLGMGFAMSPILTVALSTVAPVDAPDASGLMTTVIQLGQVAGVATIGTVFLTVAADPAAGLHPTTTGAEWALVLAVGLVGLAAVAGLQLVRSHARHRAATGAAEGDRPAPDEIEPVAA